MDGEYDLTHAATHLLWPGEDRTRTSQREIHGFYSYGIAAEVFAVVGVGAFLPVTLEQLARENGVLYSDRTTPCVGTPSGRAVLARATDGARDSDQCLIYLFGAEVTTASFAMYTFSAAVLCQALVLVSVSAFADYGDNRKRLLLMFGTVGALTSVSFIFVIPSIYLMGALLVVVGVTCLGSSFVMLNSFLPLLAANHPAIGEDQTDSADGNNTPELQISTAISSKAVGLGYSAAVLVQLLSIVVLLVMKKLTSSATLPLRLILVLAGLWWIAFMVPTALWLRSRPGPALDLATLGGHHSGAARLLAYVTFSWQSLWRTIKIAAQLRQMVKFLIAWFLLSDAQASVSGTAVLFARTELKLGPIGVAMLSITAMLSGIMGSTVFPILSKRLYWSSNRTIVACLVLMECVPLYGLLAYLPFVRNWGVGGLQVWWEIYPTAVVFGTVMGGLSSYCRSLYGSLIPPGSEAAFFALFAITDKGSSAIGPAVVGRIVDATGHIRPAFWFLAVLIALPLPLLWYTDVGAGQTDARRMSGRLRDDEGTSVEMRHVEQSEAAQSLIQGQV